jgi:iron complex outermembrane receptor protein
VNDSITLTAGAQNIFDQDAERINIPAAQGIPNNNLCGLPYVNNKT